MKQNDRTGFRFTCFNIFLVKGGSEIIKEWEGKEKLWDGSTGREKQKVSWLSELQFPKKPYVESTLKGGHKLGWKGTGCVWGGGRGLQPPHLKKNQFSFRVEFYYIYTYDYIDNTTDKGVCKSIYFHYIDSCDGRKDTDFLFVACPGRETCWSWLPTHRQLCSGQRPIRNLSC